MTDKIISIIPAVFALIILLLLAQARELMRQIGRTAEEWRNMKSLTVPMDDRSHTESSSLDSAS